ncbi:MAG: hypothetical protein K9M08_08515 [Pirellula sp.]|nr:hypothetical protein [Pirellula sp.]
MSLDTEVMFEIGVAEHPATKARLDSLTKSVLDAQSQMTQGVMGVGDAAKMSTDAVGSVIDQVRQYSQTSVHSVGEIHSAIQRLQKITDHKAQQIVEVVVRGAEAGNGFEVVEDAAANLKNVFKELGDVSQAEANRIERAFEGAIGKLPSSVAANTALIKQEYQKRVAHQAAAYSKMAADLDSAVDKQGQSTEQLNANMVKATKSVLGAAKGFMQLGLVSEENSEQMLRGLVMIEGAIGILDGGVDLLEAFSKGWKAVRQSTEAAANVSKIQQAMMGPQFAQLRAYQAQLVLEAQTANAAAIANNRLSMSRGVKGGVASSVIELAAGNVGKQAAVTAGGAVAPRAGAAAIGAGGAAVAGSGFMSTSVAGVATGALGAIASAGAALAAVGLVATELTEIFRGTSTEANSVTGSIASWEASTAASVLGMTGLFNSLESPATKLAQSYTQSIDGFIESIPILGKFKDQINFAGGAIGDFAALAASNASLARAEKKAANDRMAMEKKEAIGGVTSQAGNAIGQSNFNTNAQTLRNNAEASGSVQAKLSAELLIQARAAQDLAKYQKEAAAAAEEQGTQSRQYQDAYSQVKTYSDSILASQERQKSLVAEQSRIQLDTASKIQDGIRKEMELQDQKMGKLTDGYQSAASNFSKLGAIEKRQAIQALEFARANGGQGLRDQQKDLLRSVGTDEANRFANQGDMAEARRSGFDRSFGSGFGREKMAIEGAQRQLQADLRNSYAVTVDVKTDQQQIVDAIAGKANSIIAENNQSIIRQVTEKMGLQIQAIRDEKNRDNGVRKALGK